MIEFLDRYIAEELPATQRREFAWHLRLCGSCRAYLRTYRDTILLERKVLASEETESLLEMPDELVAAIVAAGRA
jgi:anti-sigma factor RsiW